MQKYAATARMCAREKGYFGLMELVGQYITRIMTLLALCMVWRALFMQGADMGGMTLTQLLKYTVLSSALYPLLNVRTPASSWLHDGTMLSLYLRPASLLGQLAAHAMGGWIMPLALYALPVLGFAPLIGIDMIPATPWFFPSLALSVSQGFAVDFLFACMLMRLNNLEWTVYSLREALAALLTGALIPFAALPWGLGRIFELSPFGTLAGAPLALFTGLGQAQYLVPAQIFWNLTLWPLAIWGLGKTRERLVSYGG